MFPGSSRNKNVQMLHSYAYIVFSFTPDILHVYYMFHDGPESISLQLSLSLDWSEGRTYFSLLVPNKPVI